MKTKFLLLMVALFLLGGCGPSYYSTSTQRFSIGKTTYVTNYRVIFCYDAHFAIAMDNRIVVAPTAIAIKSSENFDPFYDGQIINGQFIMIDTYTYDARRDEDGNRNVKTLPLVVPKADYSPSLIHL